MEDGGNVTKMRRRSGMCKKRVELGGRLARKRRGRRRSETFSTRSENLAEYGVPRKDLSAYTACRQTGSRRTERWHECAEGVEQYAERSRIGQKADSRAHKTSNIAQEVSSVVQETSREVQSELDAMHRRSKTLINKQVWTPYQFLSKMKFSFLAQIERVITKIQRRYASAQRPYVFCNDEKRARSTGRKSVKLLGKRTKRF